MDAIDAIVINAMSDFVLDDYLDDYDNNGIYDELITLRKQLIDERLIKVDVAHNLSFVESRVDNPDFIKSIEDLLPARTKLEFSYEVKNDTLFRARIKRAALQTQLNPNKVIGSTNLTEPVVSFNFNENNIDTVGAGDTFFALSALSIGSKIDSKIGLLISSLAASFSINQLGNISTFDLNILKKHLNHIFK